MPTINTIRSEQPYRITVGLDSAPSTVATDYTLSRQDGGACQIGVSLVWIPGGQPSVAELALDAPLLADVVYLLAIAGVGSAAVSYRPAPTAEATDDDPEAEAFGIDRVWITDQLAPGGRLPTRSGQAALKHDLAAIAVTQPGELFHRPDDGAGLRQRVNGPGGTTDQDQMAASLRRQWSKDSRVARDGVAVKVSADGTGLITADATIATSVGTEDLRLQVQGA